MKIGRYEISTRPLILTLSAFLVLFTLYCLAWVPPSPFMYRGTYVGIFIILAVLVNPPSSKIGKITIAIFALLALIGTIYPVVFEDKIAAQYYVASEGDYPFAIIFLIGLAGLITRSGGGVFILGLTGAGCLYLFFGHYIPGYFGHPPFSLTFIATSLHISADSGAFGFLTEMACRLIMIFMIFAALLITTGLGDLFRAIACWLAGSATGGPAKVSIFASAGFGMLSGSPVANVAATGSFTIPLMKNIGYRPGTAASIESLASTGGNLMPPIMGIGAFIMAEITGIPYLRICLAALIPVFLWYYTCFITVHYSALKDRVEKWRPPREELVEVIKGKIHLILAIFALIGGLFFFAAAEQAAFCAVIMLLILSSCRKGTRLTKAKVAEFLESFARMQAPLFLLVIALAIFIAAITGPGLHMKIGNVLFGYIEQWYVILIISAILIIALGMVLPISIAYLATVAILAPILGEMGYHVLIIHMFVFFVATLAPITPPVAMASYVAARIAGSDMMRTAMETTIRGLPLWIIPFVMFKKGLILGVGTPLSVIGIEVAILCFGIFIFTLGTTGYFKRDLKMFEKALALITGLMVVQPIFELYSRVFLGIGVILLVYLWWSSRSREVSLAGNIS